MDSIIRIVQAAGHDDVDELDVNKLIEVENESYMDLCVEKLADDRLSVAHYHTQRGDLMSDPEIVFDVSGNEWVPIEYTQHGFPQVHQHNPDGLDDVAGFIDEWDENIDEQGFVENAREQLGDNNE